jgi:hypothetical protein
VPRSGCLLALFVLSSSGCGKAAADPPPISWHANLEGTGVIARREGKPFFSFDGDGPAHLADAERLERTTFADPEVRALLARHFVAVRVRRLADDPVVAPLITITSATDGSEYARFDGFVSARVLAATLTRSLRPAISRSLSD